MLALCTGPGESSLLGLYWENGPYRIHPNLTLTDNPFSWNTASHLLYIDQPVGSGFSYCDQGGWPTDEAQVAAAMWTGLQGFFDRHSQYRANPLYLTGESYAGKYLPNIAAYIYKMNKASPAARRLNVKRVALGNGLYYPLDQFHSQIDLWRGWGFIGDSEAAQAEAKFQKCKAAYNGGWGNNTEAFNLCNAMSDHLNAAGGMPFLYNVQVWGNPIAEWTSTLQRYFDDPEVKAALHVGNHSWVASDGTSSPNPVSEALAADVFIDIRPKLAEVLSYYPITFYNGVYDGSCCNHLGTDRVLQGLQWSGAQQYATAKQSVWKRSGGVPGGSIREAGNLRWVRVFNSGHLLPVNQPEAALEMLHSFVFN